MAYSSIVAILTLSILLSIVVGCRLLKRAVSQPTILPEEVALSVACVFIVGGLVWLAAFLSDSSLFGFGTPWTWLAAAHFLFAGFGAITITSLSCRVVSDQHALRVLRILLVAHPIAYLVTAAGISGFRYCDELGAASYELIFVTQLWAVAFGKPDRIASFPRLLLLLALTVPVVTLIPALAWAWARPIFELSGMIRYHGVVNAVCHVGLGLVALGWGCPPAQDVQHLGLQTG